MASVKQVKVTALEKVYLSPGPAKYQIRHFFFSKMWLSGTK